jgi:radical SAM protein with 4Fe4S-binding SPASM domain
MKNTHEHRCPAPESIEVVIKPTLQCNGKCAYCNVAERPLFTDSAIIERTFENLAAYMAKNPDCDVIVLWHGGEPTLMGESFYKRVTELNRKIFTHSPTHLMQSNLTLLTEGMADVLSELLNDGGIGTSLDPFEDYRQLKNGVSYLRRWYEGFELAKSRGFRVGMVYVVHGRSVGRGKEIYYYFKNLGVDSLTLVPLEEPAGMFDGARLDTRSWGVFLTELFEAWERDNCSLPVEPFVNWGEASSVDCAPTRTYSEALNCCEPTLAISPEGDVYPCVRLLDVGSGKIGNIASESLDSILFDPEMYWRSTRRDLITQGDCGSCKWWKYCAGGCAAASGPCHKTVWCEGYKLFFEAVYV